MDSNDIVPISVAFLIIGVPLILAVVAIWIINHHRHRTKATQAIVDMYTKAIEKGEKLPENLPEISVTSKNKPLNTAIILIATGLGISLFMLLAVNDEWKLRAMSIGIIPIMMGIGYLVVHLISPKE